MGPWARRTAVIIQRTMILSLQRNRRYIIATDNGQRTTGNWSECFIIVASTEIKNMLTQSAPATGLSRESLGYLNYLRRVLTQPPDSWNGFYRAQSPSM